MTNQPEKPSDWINQRASLLEKLGHAQQFSFNSAVLEYLDKSHASPAECNCPLPTCSECGVGVAIPVCLLCFKKAKDQPQTAECECVSGGLGACPKCGKPYDETPKEETLETQANMIANMLSWNPKLGHMNYKTLQIIGRAIIDEGYTKARGKE